MNGRFLLDTNAVIAFLNGTGKVKQLISKADWVGISIITYLEFLSFENLSNADKQLFSQFAEKVEVIGLHFYQQEYLHQIISVRQQTKLKLPDAIIAATAKAANARLISNDQSFSRLSTIDWVSF